MLRQGFLQLPRALTEIAEGKAEGKKATTRERPALRPHGPHGPHGSRMEGSTTHSFNTVCFFIASQGDASSVFVRGLPEGTTDRASCGDMQRNSTTSCSRGQRSPSLPRGFQAQCAASWSSRSGFTVRREWELSSRASSFVTFGTKRPTER